MRKRPPTQGLHPPPLAVDPEKFPNLARNPALERALRIRQALQKGRPREEAVALAEQAMGPRAPVMQHARPKPTGRPASGPRPGGKVQRPRQAAKPSGRGRAAARKSAATGPRHPASGQPRKASPPRSARR